MTDHIRMTAAQMVDDMIEGGIDPDHATIASRMSDGTLCVGQSARVAPIRIGDDGSQPPSCFPIDAEATHAAETRAVAEALARMVTGRNMLVSLTDGCSRWDDPAMLHPAAQYHIGYAPADWPRATLDYVARHCARLRLVE